MVRDFTADDEGKEVVTADNDMIGTIESTQGGRAMVKPHNDLNRSVRRRLGWTAEGEDTYQLQNDKVDTIDDKVRLKSNL